MLCAIYLIRVPSINNDQILGNLFENRKYFSLKGVKFMVKGKRRKVRLSVFSTEADCGTVAANKAGVSAAVAANTATTRG